ncbi:MAG: hypothetical protein CVT88_09645 [Candidatus Altiarchaeales archaeon HGW-Altiarchaeales-1]|nr:MAG: hypothetical protein CVT88_09645 [Candidatus Altiarchaeales archaeon HGW-Altiarchaeales-1]PKP57261.1 MAG: hypothetical protein CVT89_04810 [Candidatus Altiarchaeales archaeon HGW-Altiarchaeales-2]
MESITEVKVKDAAEAVEIVKEFFRVIKGAAEIKFGAGARELIDWLDFGVISAQPLSESKDAQPVGFKITCDLKEGLFSSKKEKYEVVVSIKGEVISVKRINEE